MKLRSLAASLGIATALGLAIGALAQEKSGSAPAQPKGKAAKDKGAEKAGEPAAKTDTATFGGGCFWCMEAVFERIAGVTKVTSGYAGGTIRRPSYEDVCTGLTGHAEVIQVAFDPEKISYEKLLQVFWIAHDPTTLNRQGPDFGTQYRSAIFYHDDAQKEAASKSQEEMTAAGMFRNPIVTEIVPLKAFYPAEAYHQNYYRRHRNDAYCQAEIVPKLRKLKLPLK